MGLTTLCLTLCLASPPSAVPELIPPPAVEVGKAPGLPQLPADLPTAEQSPDGTWIPYPTDVLLSRWITYVTYEYPVVVQQAIDEKPTGWQTWQVVGVGVGCVVLGVLTGHFVATVF